jgi:predicted DCC family thiol-disulfide oxidoreductase YuxK
MGSNNLEKIIMQVRDDIKKSHFLYEYLKQNKKIILFDGECNLCDGSVQFLLENDSNDIFRFASLQSDFGKKIQHEYGIDSSRINSVILIDDYVQYKSKTNAMFSIIQSMGKFWKLLFIFWIIPKPIRDWVYMRVAKNRYDLFGKKNTCMIMTKDIMHKFLGHHV